MTDQLLTEKALASLTDAIDRIDPGVAHQAVGRVSVGLGVLAVVAPKRTAALFGVRSLDPALPLLVRMIGIRNATAGAATLRAEGNDLSRALQAGLVLGVVDVAAVVLAARKGVLTRQAAARTLLVLGGIAVLGIAARRD